jgi:hypothetical protein
MTLIQMLGICSVERNGKKKHGFVKNKIITSDGDLWLNLFGSITSIDA